MKNKEGFSENQNSDSQKTEKRLREVSGYLHSLIAAIEDIIFELDGNFVFLNVWAKDESLLFMPKSQFLGKTIREAFGDQADRFVQIVERAIREGAEASTEYHHLDSSVEKWYRAKAVPVEEHEDPSEYRMVLIVQDI